jgi:hypothetical protein
MKPNELRTMVELTELLIALAEESASAQRAMAEKCELKGEALARA